MKHQKHTNADTPSTPASVPDQTADQATQATTPVAATTPTKPTTPATKAEPVKTPEQRANAMRREAGELDRSARPELLGDDAAAKLKQRAQQLRDDADLLSPKKTKSSSEPRPTCAGTKKDGTACTAKAMDGSTFCTDHRPVRARFTDAEWNAFGLIPRAVIIEQLGWGVALKLAKAQLAIEEAAAAEQFGEKTTA